MSDQALPQNKSSSRRYRKASDWRELVEGFESSKLTIAQFCNENGIAQSGFYHWRKKFQYERAGEETEAPEAHASFIELPIQNASSSTPAPFQQWDIELELGANTVLRIRRA